MRTAALSASTAVAAGVHAQSSALPRERAPRALPYDPTRGEHPGRNVAAILRGSDPGLRHTHVAIGAHSDHDGIGRYAIDHDSSHALRLNKTRLRRVITDSQAWDSAYHAYVVNVDGQSAMIVTFFRHAGLRC